MFALTRAAAGAAAAAITLAIVGCGGGAAPASADVQFCRVSANTVLFDQNTVNHLRGPLEADAGAYLYDPSAANRNRVIADCAKVLKP